MTKACITTFNHKSLDGVAEIAELLDAEFSRSGFDSNICRALPKQLDNDDLLIVIDEFSEPLIVEALLNFRSKHPKVKMVCVLTEFFSPRSSIRPPSLNNFKQPEQSLVLDNLLYVYCTLSGHLKLFSHLQIKSPGFLHYMLGIFGFIWLTLLKIANPHKPIDKLRVFHERGYLWFRALGLQSISGIFDLYLALHPDIASEALIRCLNTNRDRIYNFLIPPPVVNRSELINPDLEFGFDFSGSLTGYRRKKLKALTKMMRKISPGQRFSGHMTRGFDDSKIKYVFSYNPPQSASWRYCSPMRIIGAIKRGQIPIATEKFGDHPAEDLVLVFPTDPIGARALTSELLLNPSDYLNAAWERLKNYREIVDANNRDVIRRLAESTSIHHQHAKKAP